MSKIHKITKRICPVCYTECDSKNIVIFHKTRRQTHILCCDCAENYLRPKLKIITRNLQNNNYIQSNNFDRYGSNYWVSCPGNCHGELRNFCSRKSFLHKMIFPSNFALNTDIFRILYVLKNENYVICLNNDCLNLIETNSNYAVCSECKTEFCKQCTVSPYHKNLSCLEYQTEQKNSETGKFLFERKEKGILKFCPGCHTATEKVTNNQGKFVACNKIFCVHCGIKWCWLCKAKNIDYDHFRNGDCKGKLWKGIDEKLF